MGQAISSQRRQQESSQNTSGSNTDDHAANPNHHFDTNSLPVDPLSSPQAGPSRPASIRRSILNLVKSSRRDRSDSTTSSLRKSWRHSRRWSKAPADVDTAPASNLPEASAELANPTAGKGKGVQRFSETPYTDRATGISDSGFSDLSSTLASSSNPSSNIVEESAEEEVERRDAHIGRSTWDGLEDLERHDALGQPSEDPVPTLPAPLDASPTVNEAYAPHPPAEALQESNDHAQPVHPSGRQFPPPGTLVVVQGVVHTTDVPRLPPMEPPVPAPRSSSLPPNPSADIPRNRLSSLLRSRPTSSIAPGSPSVLDTSSPSSLSAFHDSTLHSDNPSSDTLPSRIPSHAELPNLESANPVPESPLDSQPGTISSSSIDVLGTLLSVAAAATAASLLTGTTESTLQPHVNPPSYSPSSAAAARSMPDGSTVASPPDPWTHSSPPPHSVGPDPSAAGRAERLRHAWGSIRERLGLRPTPPAPTTGSVTGGDSDTSPGLTSTDPRELVLAQMARAFNVGFGLGDGVSTPTNREGPVERNQTHDSAGPTQDQDESSPLPPDGSFERFLVDLQSDLRTALTHNQSLPEVVSASDPPVEGVSEDSEPIDEAPIVEDSVEGRSDTESLSQEIYGSDARFEDDHETVSPSSSLGQVASSPMPSPGIADHETAGVPARSNRLIETQDTDSQGRINWWRLYRFPPIATRTPGGVSLPATRPPAPSTVASTVPRPEATQLSPEAMDPTLSELPFANVDVGQDDRPDRARTVVPVIVVGLQSVNTSWPSTPHPEENTGESDPFGGLDEDGPDESPDSIPQATAQPSRADGSEPSSARGRAWHSRAAEALRNLRPGRRQRTAPSSAAGGSRTFLIYVIGGYYPPDHSIVTGGPNTLDSFEALLELAELLGQVKPPTVTKEDIEKSGLETIRATQLQEYEHQQKISSNCIDKCLICLDDYEPEDKVRVMKCRHAFHMACVDKWLETGRNNCPACRSRGVSVS